MSVLYNIILMFSRPARSAASATVKICSGQLNKGDAEFAKNLSRTQFLVLRKAKTEPRGIVMGRGGFDDHFVPVGEYLCAACDSPLYLSDMKFDCGCGWPGFWTNIKDAVCEREEKDGSGRTEIVCSACTSHLGHLFRGESFKNPEPNERHCVNSVSLKFKSKDGDITHCTYQGPVF
jgi:peptide-methionine (R)-S-oxide reductase